MSPVTATEYRPYVPQAGTAPGQSGVPTGHNLYTAVAVFTGTEWEALCRELDIASLGDNADQALANVEQAVREALAYAAEEDRPAGVAVRDNDLLEFIQGHRSEVPVVTAAFMA